MRTYILSGLGLFVIRETHLYRTPSFMIVRRMDGLEENYINLATESKSLAFLILRENKEMVVIDC